MSISLRLVNALLRKSGVKKMYDRPAEEINEMIRRKNAKRKFAIAESNEFAVSRIYVDEREVLFLRNRTKGSERALLYLYSGGFTAEISGLEKRFAQKLGAASGRDVWIPRYPNGMDHTADEIYRMALDTYAEMLKKYDAKDIAVAGCSAGATIAIAMFEMNNTLENPLSPADMIISCSPCSMPCSDAEEKEIKELAEKDVMIPVSFVSALSEIMTHGEELPEWMTKLPLGDLHHMPCTHIYYGTCEVLSAAAVPLQKAYRRDHSLCTLQWGENLFHGYPAADFIPEARQAFDEIAELLRN